MVSNKEPAKYQIIHNLLMGLISQTVFSRHQMIDRRMVITKYLYTLNNRTALSYKRPFSSLSVGQGDRTLLFFDKVLFIFTQHQAILNFVTAGDVTRTIKGLNNTKAEGVDSIPTVVLKKGVAVLAGPQ